MLLLQCPENVSLLKSFLGSVQFYQKFLPGYATIAEPLYCLTRKNERWNWTMNQENAFQHLKLLVSNVLLSHFDKQLPVGIYAMPPKWTSVRYFSIDFQMKQSVLLSMSPRHYVKLRKDTAKFIRRVLLLRLLYKNSTHIFSAGNLFWSWSTDHNARAFTTGDEFQGYMKERGIQHLTNGQAERCIQTFKSIPCPKHHCKSFDAI